MERILEHFIALGGFSRNSVSRQIEPIYKFRSIDQTGCSRHCRLISCQFQFTFMFRDVHDILI